MSRRDESREEGREDEEMPVLKGSAVVGGRRKESLVHTCCWESFWSGRKRVTSKEKEAFFFRSSEGWVGAAGGGLTGKTQKRAVSVCGYACSLGRELACECAAAAAFSFFCFIDQRMLTWLERRTANTHRAPK